MIEASFGTHSDRIPRQKEPKTNLMCFPSKRGVGKEADVDDENAALGGVPHEQQVSLRVGHIPRLVVADGRRPLGLDQRRKAVLKLPKLAPTGVHARRFVYTRESSEAAASSIGRRWQLTQWRQTAAKFESLPFTASADKKHLGKKILIYKICKI